MREMGIPASLDAGDESIAAFVTRRLGSEAVDWLAEPLLAGIYNAEPERMSLLATFPQFRTLEREHGSLINGLRTTARATRNKARGPAFLSLRGGMQELTDTLAAKVVSIARPNTTVQQLQRLPSGHYHLICDRGQDIVARSVVVTLPSIDTARLLETVAPTAANELGRLRTVGAGSISLAFRTEEIRRPLTGYGLVIPRREGRPINAITIASAKFAGRAPEGWELLRIFFGGARSAETMFYNEDRLLTVVREQLQDLLGIEAEPAFYRLYRWRTGSPQYDVGHLDRIAAIESALPTGLLLAGGTYHGVGIPDIVRTATGVAAGIATQGQPSLPSYGRGEKVFNESFHPHAFPFASQTGDGAKG
jgi:oxygen-dependent protoporphyrinogen oxidase